MIGEPSSPGSVVDPRSRMHISTARPLRIAQVAPLYETVPPTGYGGTERVVAALCDELVDRGHHVTLFASGGSRTDARLVAATSAPLRSRMSKTELEEVAPHLHLRMFADLYARGHEFDIIHAHTDLWTLPFVHFPSTPTVMTLHGRLDLASVQRVLPLYPEVPLVSISHSQREPLAGCAVTWAGTVPNGLRYDGYFDVPRGAGDYLAFVGRLTPEKRPDLAVEIARRTGLPLRVAAKVDPVDATYYEEVIEPLFRANRVDFIGEIGEADKPAFFAGALATVMPIDWPEPFGLVFVESLAAGTPVITMRRGAAGEVVEHGVSGFVCDSIDEMVSAVSLAETIDPAACRRRAHRFDATAMADGYLRVYRSVMAMASGDHAREPSSSGSRN